MTRRSYLTFILFATTIATGGAAIWQTLAVSQRDAVIAELRTFLTQVEHTAGLATNEKHALEMDLQQARAGAAGDGEPESMAALRTDLEATRQQLSAAETAMIETEDRLAEEIASHAALKAKAQAMADQLDAATNAIEAADARAERAESELAKLNALGPAKNVDPGAAPSANADAPKAEHNTTGATGSLPDDISGSQSVDPLQTTEPAAAAPEVPKTAVKKYRPRRTAKPPVKAIKPGGGIFEPLL